MIYLCAFFTVHQVFYLQLTKLMKLKSISGTERVCAILNIKGCFFPITMNTFDTRWWVFEARDDRECCAILVWTMAVLFCIVNVADQASKAMVYTALSLKKQGNLFFLEILNVSFSIRSRVECSSKTVILTRALVPANFRLGRIATDFGSLVCYVFGDQTGGSDLSFARKLGPDQLKPLSWQHFLKRWVQ